MLRFQLKTVHTEFVINTPQSSTTDPKLCNRPNKQSNLHLVGIITSDLVLCKIQSQDITFLLIITFISPLQFDYTSHKNNYMHKKCLEDKKQIHECNIGWFLTNHP